MTVDLRPRNPIVPYHSGSFSWAWMLDEGVGLVIGAGRVVPGKFCWIADRDGCPYYNDGFRVTAEEARGMARAARALVERERARWDWWSAADEQMRKLFAANAPVREDFIEKAEAFAWFAFASGGFRVY